MKRALLCLSLLIINYGILFAEEQITITTYYPSPYGSYNALQADKLGVGDNNGDGSLTSADVPTTSGDVWIKDKVGIGTMNPLAKLTVNNNITGVIPAFPAITIGNPSGTAALMIGKDSNNHLTVDWLDPDRARIFTGFVSSTKPLVLQEYGGNVGIGNTSPIGPLTVGNSAVDGSDGFIVIGKRAGGGTRHFRVGFDPSFKFTIGDYGNMNTAGTWGKAFSMDWNTPDNTLALISSGNVGIGTAAPTKPLSIYGGAEQLRLSQNDSNGWLLWGGGNLHFRTVDGTDRVFFGGDGNVGIGTIGPTAKLDVAGRAKATFFVGLPMGGYTWTCCESGPPPSTNEYFWGVATAAGCPAGTTAITVLTVHDQRSGAEWGATCGGGGVHSSQIFCIGN